MSVLTDALLCWVIGFVICTDDLSTISITYGSLGYAMEGGGFMAGLTLENTGKTDIDTKEKNVHIYSCFIRQILHMVGARFTHLDGCAYRLDFMAPFKLSAGERSSYTLHQSDSLVTYTDITPNWHIQLGNDRPKLIANTQGDPKDFAIPLIHDNQTMRSSADRQKPPSLEERYNRYLSNKVFSADEIKGRLIPRLFDSKDFAPKDYTKLVSVSYKENSSFTDDEHEIRIDPDGAVVIVANSQASLTRSNSTLPLLLERFGNKLPVGTYRTKPRFQYRGLILDVARHFHNKETIKRLIELLWRYKLNTLQLHLTEDEAWALEIEGLPELTEYGSRQCFNRSECANYPLYGRVVDSARHYLTKDDYIEILKHANRYGITIIPEIEILGHSTAAINSMEHRWKLDPNGVDYRLHHPADGEQTLSTQMYRRAVINPCVNSTYTFAGLIMKTLKSYHEKGNHSLKFLHLGGDEGADKWKNSSICNKMFQNVTDSDGQIKRMLFKRFGELARDLNISLGFWEDGIVDTVADNKNNPLKKEVIFPGVDVYVNGWKTVWGWGEGFHIYPFANEGYKVILTPSTHYFMDHVQEIHPEERGFYWASRYIDLKRTYSWKNDNIYNNINGIGIFGIPQSKDGTCKDPNSCVKLQKPENIVGGSATLFGETMFNETHIHNNLWPRLLAVADRLWSRSDWEVQAEENPPGFEDDFDLFRLAVGRFEIPYLDRSGFVYHLSPPGVQRVGKTDELKFNTEFENQRIWYRNETERIKVYLDSPFFCKPGNTIYVSTSDSQQKRFSYEIPYKCNSSSTIPTIPLTGFAVWFAAAFLFL